MNPQRSISPIVLHCLIVFSALTQAAAFAKDPPLPDALLNAKTAFVQNDGSSDKDFEKFCKEMIKWGRFVIVAHQSGADIVISFGQRTRTGSENITTPDHKANIKTSFSWKTSFVRIGDSKAFQLYYDETGYESKNPGILVSNLKRTMKDR